MKPLNDENKRAEVLMKQLEEAWKNFDRRRAYEWKLSLSIWTALAVFLALAMRGEISVPLYLQLLLLIPAGGILAVHLYFNMRVKLANDVDKRKAELCEDLLYEAAGVAESDLSRVKEAIARVKLSDGKWSKTVHVGITTLLILAAAFSLNAPSEVARGIRPISQDSTAINKSLRSRNESQQTTSILNPLSSIVAILEIPLIILSLVLTRNHFRKARAARFIERFNSPDMISIRVSVDRWLDSSPDEREKLGMLETDLELAARVKIFANLFVELGAAYRERSVDRGYVDKVFPYLVRDYWSRLQFWVISYREKAQRPTLYDTFETLMETMAQRENKAK